MTGPTHRRSAARRPAGGLAAALLGFALAAGAIVGSSAVAGDGPRELGWENLLPGALVQAEQQARALQRRVQSLPPGEREAFQKVAIERTALGRLESGHIAEDELTTREREALAEKPGERYPEALALWREIEAARAVLEASNAAVEPALDGERVRIPGYVLPLEFEGDLVREFLLVPYVGACIHTPPPPPNQIVFVRPAEGFASEGLFSPVWVEGRMSADGGQHDLSLVDGTAPIDVGYSLDAVTVEPYTR